MPTQRIPAVDRVLVRIKVHPLGCWEFQGALNLGYGMVGSYRPDGTPYNTYAHRVVYEDWCGAIPKGLDLDHLCANPRCVNPTHLEPVTRSENVKRQWRDGRADPTRTYRERNHCSRGHEYTPENTYMYKGHRHCRACTRLRDREKRR